MQFRFELLKDKLQREIVARRDFRTTRHIVVFESDDWGSIRMPNKETKDALVGLGYAVDKRPYERFDTLESPEDIEALFEVLLKYKNNQGQHPVITANMLMANPDFERIEHSGFCDYFYEPISNTYLRYFGDTKAIDYLRQGHQEGLFMPQYHGREHFNVEQWMKGLQLKDEDLLTAFRYGMCGIAPKLHPEHGNKMMMALWAEDERGQKQINEIVEEGLSLFEQFWGFKSKTFVAPCYCWSEEVERLLFHAGVQLIQASRTKKAAFNSPPCHYYTGYRNHFGQFVSIRNCSFEPSTDNRDTSIKGLLKQVEATFAQHKIAVFSTHRINYVGGIDEDNRTQNLQLLDRFLSVLLAKYPDVEFLSSDKLIDIFNDNYN